MDQPRVIAIDGPAASGKGTIARRLAEHFSLAYLDTGSLYRKTAYLVIESGGDPANEDDAAAAANLVLNRDVPDSELRTQKVADAASVVAALPPVREALRNAQRDFGEHPPKLPSGDEAKGAVVDGRDIGTVIFPEAPVKLFITASPEERARRRHLEMLDRGQEGSFTDILAEVRARDARDADRPISPMVPASDAHLLDTTDLSIEAAFEAARDIAATALS